MYDMSGIDHWLPFFFVCVIGIAMLAYMVLDGYDLGIGMLLPLGTDTEKDQMIASIGPFWDANETWIVLGIGVLLIAFPAAHSEVLTTLYLGVFVMLFGLILRGVAFDFRVKAQDQYQPMWNKLFFAGSLIASMAQGWMLGRYIMGLESDTMSFVFAGGIALTLPCFYIMLGCGWIFVKSGNLELVEKARQWALRTMLPLGIGIVLVSIATPIASETIAARWFGFPNIIGLLPIPIATWVMYGFILWMLRRPDIIADDYGWMIFVAMVVICLMCAIGLAYSIFPFIVIDKLTIWETASATESLWVVFIGAVIVVPMIIGYTIFIYKVFKGKLDTLSYT